MSTQRAELIERLAEHGWSARALPEDELEWWADEMWLLESTRTPVGSRAFVTFLVDPQVGELVNRLKGQGVWAVMASREKPAGWQSAEGTFTLSLGRGWEERLPSLVEHLSALRERGRGDA